MMATKLIKTARPVAKLRAGRNDWYRMSAKADGVTAEVHIYDEIGYWGVTAQDFIRDLQLLDVGQIDVHLNTPGGDVFEGIAIYNALRQHPANIAVYVDSLAASIGSVIAMAGDKVIMAKYSTMMIHEASGVAIGANAQEMRTMADLLDKTSQNLAQVYADRSGTDVEDWRDRMKAETWFSAEEAVEFGLADEVSTNNVKVNNSWDLSIFAYPGREAAPAPTGAPAAPPHDVLVGSPVAPVSPPGTRRPSPSARAPEEASPGGGGVQPEMEFTFDASTFRKALDFAANPPVPEHEAPFEFDPEIFRAVLADRANNAPAVALLPADHAPATFEDAYDPEFLAGVIREMVP